MSGERRKQRKRSPKQCAAELGIAKRQEAACQLRLAGWSVRDIAGHLKCSVGTVHSDISAVLERTRDTAADAIDKQRRLSLARVDKAVRAIWAKVEAGDLDACRELMRLEQRRAKVEGFDAADRHEVSGPGGAPIPIEPRTALNAKLDELAKRILGDTGEPGGNAGARPDPSS
jgi:hypothetical protein